MEKRGTRMTKCQKEFFINYLEDHKLLIESKMNPKDIAKVRACWEELAGGLNNLPGAKKNIKGWKDVSFLLFFRLS